MKVYVSSNLETRKKLHDYFDSQQLFSTSFYCDRFDTETKRYWKCYCGQDHQFGRDDYRYGSEDNNSDEYYAIYCPTYDEVIYWEPNYDGHDRVRTVCFNNVICVGDCLKNVSKKKKYVVEKSIDEKEFQELVSQLQVFEIPEVFEFPGKTRLQKHLKQYLR